MQLSPHFSLSELCVSNKARELGIDNTPPSYMFPTMSATATGMEQVRSVLGDLPITVANGYRCPALNRAVGGEKRSQHLLGEAVDFQCPAFGTPTKIVTAIVNSDVPYDQVICEHLGYKMWVHVSFSSRNRREALLIDSAGTRPFVC